MPSQLDTHRLSKNEQLEVVPACISHYVYSMTARWPNQSIDPWASRRAGLHLRTFPPSLLARHLSDGDERSCAWLEERQCANAKAKRYEPNKPSSQ